MKVIMKKTGEVQEVSAGHARNYLIPQGLAEAATPEKISAARELQKKIAHELSEEEASWELWAKKFPTLTVEMSAAANTDGTLFGAISESAILQEMSRQHQAIVKSEWLRISAPIKRTGVHDIGLVFPNKLTTLFHINVSPQ